MSSVITTVPTQMSFFCSDIFSQIKLPKREISCYQYLEKKLNNIVTSWISSNWIMETHCMHYMNIKFQFYKSLYIWYYKPIIENLGEKAGTVSRQSIFVCSFERKNWLIFRTWNFSHGILFNLIPHFY